MVTVITKKTTKKQFDAILNRMRDRRRKKRSSKLMALCGSVPLHIDPVEFQRSLRDE